MKTFGQIIDINPRYSIGHGLAEPIGLEYIFSTLENYGYNPLFKNRFEIELSVAGNSRKLSLFSSTSPEWNEVLLLNQQAQKRGNITVIGGYHITGTYQENINIPFDYAVIGEGEEIIKDVISDIITNNGIRQATTKYYLSEPIRNLDNLPFPARNADYLSNYKILDLMWPPRSQQFNTAIILASRGCNYQCSFCASSAMWGRDIRLRSPQNIIEEISYIKMQFKTNTFVFIDQALGQDSTWTRELCHEMIRHRLDINWYLQTNITINRELIPLLAEAGCKKIGFGIEGMSQKTVKKIKPVNRMSIEEINDLFSYCNKFGLFVKCYFLLGFPWETQTDIHEYHNFISEIEANVIKISFFTPFPGTKDWIKYKNQLVINDWGYFDTVSIPVVKNLNINVNEYLDIRKNLFHTFYTSDKYYKTLTELLEMFPHYKNSFYEFYDFLKNYEMLPNNVNRQEWLSHHINQDVI
jgi:anaerobic magnesium-protoporphyrin IX monomethyl ester cyclase